MSAAMPEAQSGSEGASATGAPALRASAAPAAAPRTVAPLLVAATCFLSASLLFFVEPLIARRLLPWFGGTPALWSACLMFFQGALLAGYLYAHLVVTRLPAAAQRPLHLGVVWGTGALLLWQWRAWGAPILLSSAARPEPGGEPLASALGLLVAAIGAPFFTLSTTGPLQQSWLVAAVPRSSPYRIFALSNLASLLALALYPVAVEPWLPLSSQARLFGAGYLAFALLGTAAALATAGGRAVAEATPRDASADASDGESRVASWITLSALGSVVLLAGTNQMCQEVAVVPFLWILPLSLYLLTLVVCFEWPGLYRRGPFTALLLVAAIAEIACLFERADAAIPLQIAANAAFVATACMVFHGELALSRPGGSQLTRFYLWVAVGSSLGAVAVSLVAPMLLEGYWELHAGILAATALAIHVLWKDRTSWLHVGGGTGGVVVAALLTALAAGQASWTLASSTAWALVWGMATGIVIGAVGLRRPRLRGLLVHAVTAATGVVLGAEIHASLRPALLNARGFFGAISVIAHDADDPTWRCLSLRHGAITHGFQYTAPDKRSMPASYYGSRSGAATAVARHPARASGRSLRVGVAGLGVGGIAAHGCAGDLFRFYEINPDVVRIARGKEAFFSYLDDAPFPVEIVTGDARLAMERELAAGDSQGFDVLVLDAFTSDAIPVHLITREAILTYLGHLAPDGVLVFNISNRHVDLGGVLARLAAELGLTCGYIEAPAEGDVVWSGTWMLLSRSKESLEALAVDPAPAPSDDLWTDDYSNLFRQLT